MTFKNDTRLLQLMSFILAGLKIRNFGPLPPDLKVDGQNGKWEVSLDGKPYASFEGIRYAKPPIGALRFKDPLPLDDPVPSVNEGRMIDCLHVNPLNGDIFGQEDCLFLNVYTTTPGKGKYLPVMVWFHGSAFLMGTNRNSMYGPQRLMNHDMVLVTVSYRIGPLGFASKEVPDFPGNYGFRDQKIAIKWVERRIENFGGDPTNITLAGHGSGAVDIFFHLQKFVNISKGIALSGTQFAPWMLSNLHTVREHTADLIDALGCKKKEIFHFETLKCLRSVDAVRLVKTAHHNVRKKVDRIQIPFRLVQDSYNIRENPMDILSHHVTTTPPPLMELDEFGVVREVRKRTTETSLMVTVTKDEAAVVFNDEFSLAESPVWKRRYMDKVFNRLYMMRPNFTHDVSYDKFMDYYSKMKDPEGRLLQLMSDTWFHFPVFRLSQVHDGPFLPVMFNYKSSLKHLGCTVPRMNDVVAHGDELPFIFVIKDCNDDVSYDRIGDKWVELIADFLHKNDGLPNVPNPNQDKELYDMSHLHQKTSSKHSIDQDLKERLSHWNKYGFINV